MIYAILLFLASQASAVTDTFTTTTTATATATATATPTRTASFTPTRTMTPPGTEPFSEARIVVIGYYDPATKMIIPGSFDFPFMMIPPVPKGTARPWDPDPISVLSSSTFVMPWDATYCAIDIRNHGDASIWLKWGGGTAVAGNGIELKFGEYVSLGLPHAAEGLSAIVTSTPQALKIVRHPIR